MSLRNKKLLYIFNAGDWDSRYALAQAAQEQGAEVTICLIGAKERDQNKAPDMKVILLHKKKGIAESFATTLYMLRDIRNIIAKEKPDIIHSVTLKYSFITALAALGAGRAKKLFTIAGLGYLYRSDDAKSILLRYMLWPFFIFAFAAKRHKSGFSKCGRPGFAY